MGGTVDLRPDTFAEGGGLIDDFDGIISDIRFIMTDYDGAIQDTVPVCAVKFDIDGEEVAPTLYSVGGADDFAPNESGMGLTKLKSKDTLTKTSKFGMLLASIVEAGFPLNKMESDDISYLVGLDGHFLRQVVTFKGLVKKKDDRENTVLLCTKLNRLPGEGEKVGKGKKGKTVEVEAGLADDVASAILGVIVESEGDLPKKNMLSKLFKHPDIIALPNKKAALKLASDDKFLKGREEWTYEDGLLKM